MAFVPPAPRLPGEAALEYPGSLPSRALEETNKFSDSGRLQYLGRMMSAAAYTDVMAQRWPAASAEQLQGMVENTLNGLMERSAAAYQWGNRVHGYPPDFNRQGLEEARRLFCTYAGAVYVEHGYMELKTWIATLASL
ncbi:hypothetical protein TRAPUB_14383 [Trametes pubescens]|uniref:Uncharacterized protein n=1 Tax=Trametes pubescens TaxID=154538 RepID=A0A1M2VNM6_TRAPU|nr:hypothetical protein TRAPUB_14383 [Trametes pubescens]